MAMRSALALEFNRRGFEKHKAGDRDRAIRAYSMAIGLRPDFEVALCNRGQAYLENLSLDLAIADLTEAIRLNPNRAVSFYNRSAAYLKKGLPDQGVADFVAADRLDPCGLDVFCIWYRDLDAWEHHQIVELTEELRTAPDYIKFYSRGYRFALIGAREAAVADYTESLRLKPDNAATYSQRGRAHHGLSNWDLALADYNEAIRLSPTSDSFRTRGLVYAQKGVWDLAIADYNAAIELEPECAVLFRNRSSAYQQQGNSEQAERDVLRAEQLELLAQERRRNERRDEEPPPQGI